MYVNMDFWIFSRVGELQKGGIRTSWQGGGRSGWARTGQAKARQKRQRLRLLLLPVSRASSGDLGGGHEVADVLLEELVVRVELVVLFLDRLYAVVDLEKGFLEELRMSKLGTRG